MTQVQSLVSCRHTRAGVHIEPNAESVPIATLIRVHLFAKDVDDLPISFTRAEVSLGFGDQTIPMQWTRGSNQYVADVPTELISQPGRYDLVVRANNAWNETGSPTTCELLRRTISVKDATSTPCPAGTYGANDGRGVCRLCDPGRFQPDQGQYSCLNCDSLGDFFQEQPGQTFCRACAANTIRYIGESSSSANKSSCQCKEGAYRLACVCVRAFVRGACCGNMNAFVVARFVLKDTTLPEPNPERLVWHAQKAELAPGSSALPSRREIGGESMAVLCSPIVEKTKNTAGVWVASTAVSCTRAVFASIAAPDTTLGLAHACSAPTASVRRSRMFLP